MLKVNVFKGKEKITSATIEEESLYRYIETVAKGDSVHTQTSGRVVSIFLNSRHEGDVLVSQDDKKYELG